MDISFLWTFDKYFLIKVKLLCTIVLIKRIEICDIICVCIWIGESEFHFLVLVFEMKVKGAL